MRIYVASTVHEMISMTIYAASTVRKMISMRIYAASTVHEKISMRIYSPSTVHKIASMRIYLASFRKYYCHLCMYFQSVNHYFQTILLCFYRYSYIKYLHFNSEIYLIIVHKPVNPNPLRHLCKVMMPTNYLSGGNGAAGYSISNDDRTTNLKIEVKCTPAYLKCTTHTFHPNRFFP